MSDENRVGLNVRLPADRNERAIHLRLLDGFYLYRGGVLCRLSADAQRLLAFLALKGTQERSRVAAVLWPQVSEGKCSGSLRTALWRLNRSCPGIVDVSREKLNVSRQATVDVNGFTAVAWKIIKRPSEATVLRYSSGYFRGDLLPGWYDEWVAVERDRLEQLRLHALERLAVHLVHYGHHAAALEAAQTAVRIEPLRESAHRAVISVHLAEGNVAAAVRQYERCRDLLEAELGIAPAAETTALLPGRCR